MWKCIQMPTTSNHRCQYDQKWSRNSCLPPGQKIHNCRDWIFLRMIPSHWPISDRFLLDHHHRRNLRAFATLNYGAHAIPAGRFPGDSRNLQGLTRCMLRTLPSLLPSRIVSRRYRNSWNCRYNTSFLFRPGCRSSGSRPSIFGSRLRLFCRFAHRGNP